VDASRALRALDANLVAADFTTSEASIGGRAALVGRRSEFRWAWVATRLHTFVVAFAANGLDAGLAADLTAAAQAYAIKHKGGLPRGLQNGTATIAVFVGAASDPGLRDWFGAKPRQRYAALRLPVLIDLESGELVYFSRQMRTGGIYGNYLHRVIDDVIAPAADVRGDPRPAR
jgi:hypothetical protein